MTTNDNAQVSQLAARLAALSPEKQALLAKKLAQRSADRGELRGEQITPRAETGPAPLSHAQELLWLYEQMAPGTDAYNVPITRRIRGPLDVGALRRALDAVVAHHDSLRTSFVEQDGVPRQVVRPPAAVPIEVHDVRTSLANDREGEGRAILRRAAACPFNLVEGAGPRVALVRLSDDDALLLIVVHHIVFDGGSVDVLLRDLGAAYEAVLAKRDPALSPLPIQLTDFAAWERATQTEERLAPSLAFWRDYLNGAPTTIALPTDRPRTNARWGPAARAVRALSAEARDAVRRIARAHDATPFMVLLAVFQTLLHRYSAQDDLIVASPIAGRARPETQHLIGYLATTFVVRARFDDDPTFAELVERNRRDVLRAFEHPELPSERLLQEMPGRRGGDAQPLFDTMFVLQDGSSASATLGTAALEPMRTELGAAKFDIVLSMAETSSGLRAVLDYRSDLLEPGTADRMLEHFSVLLAASTTAPDTRVSCLSLLEPTARHRVLREFNATSYEYPSGTLDALVDEQVARSPDAVAVQAVDGHLTFRELDASARQLAARLRARGVAHGSLVGVLMDRSCDMVVAMLAVLKAGGAYVPLDPEYPPARIDYLIRDAAARLVITHARLAALAMGAEVLVIDAPNDTPESGAPNEGAIGTHGPNDAAYVIYTSGSTGAPKGVVVPHRAIVNHMRWMQRAFPIDAGDAVLQKTAVSFDASVWEFWSPLMTGARLIMASPGAHREPSMLADAICAANVTVLQLVPSMLAVLLDEPRFRECRSLRHVYCGGEALAPELVERLRALLDVDVHNLYGPAEATIDATVWSAPPTPVPVTSVPIGQPVDNVMAYVLSPGRELEPVGVPGELYLGGAGVALGYHGRAELTASRFLPDPFASGADARMYRTGDRARWRADGQLEYLGRMDTQVKLHGVRIELGEIEAALLEHDDVQAAAVAVKRIAGEQHLVGYCVARDGASPSTDRGAALRTSLRRSLPEYLVPAIVMMLDALPTTPNGKVDRDALPAPAAIATVRTYIAPRTPTEVAVATAFSDVLHIERVGADDDFYELGGHSLVAMRVAGRLSALCNATVPVRFVFEHPGVRALAAAIDGAADTRHGAPAIELVSREAHRRHAPPLNGAMSRDGDVFVFPASSAQARIFFLEELSPGNSTFNVPLACRFHGALDVAALQTAIDGIVARHEVMRTTFAVENDLPVQVIHASESVPISLHDFSSGPEPAAVAWSRLRDAANAPFDLRRLPVMRAALFRVAPDDHLFLIALHHIAADGWSVGTLQRELEADYAAAAAGTPPRAAAPKIQYADYTMWQRGELSGDPLAELEAYWREKLQGPLPILDLPMFVQRPATLGARPVARVSFPVPRALASRVRALASVERATPFMVYLAAFQALLSRYTDQDDIIVGTPMSGRGAPELDGVVGPFINMLALRTDLANNPSFRELVGRVRDVAVGAFSRGALPFERVIDVVKPPRNEAITPIFQVMFSMQNAAAMAAERTSGDLDLPGVRVERVGATLESTKYDVSLTIVPDGDAYRGSLDYDASLFDAERMDRFAAHLRRLLERAVDDPAQAIGDIDFLESAERTQLVSAWNATAVQFPSATLVDLLSQQVARTPGAIAVEDERRSLTYSELDAAADALAHRLHARGVGAGALVGVCAERSVELVVALVATLKAGAAYVPLDSEYPADRLAFMIEDSGVAALLTTEALATTNATLGSRGTPTIFLDAADEVSPVTAEPLPAVRPDMPAYMIYTSGSTGRPKGALNAHHGIVNRLLWMQSEYQLDATDVVLQKTPFSFDVSVWEFFWPLLTGAKLVMARPGGHRDTGYLVDVISTRRVSVCHFVPSMLRAFLTDPGAARCTTLRDVMASGEALPPDVVAAFYTALPNARLHNLYGPTECAVDVTYWPCPPSTTPPTVVPIGRPVANTEVYVLDARRNPVPVGVPGELYLAGVQVGLGYHGRPELTAERFVADRFSAMPAARMYRTGDKARWRPDGNVEYLGRLDFQVKLRGFRIELGEVETALGAHPAVQSAVVLVREDVPGNQRLVAYCIARGEIPPGADTTAELTATVLEGVKQVLPSHMVPNALVWLEAWPLSPNGKLDRKALPVPPAPGTRGTTTSEPPRTALEECIVGAWREVLKLSDFGIDANFFDLGGHSLLAMQVVSMLSRMFGRTLTLRAFFEHSTVRSFAESLTASEEIPGRTDAIARALIRLRDMSPEERERRRRAAVAPEAR